MIALILLAALALVGGIEFGTVAILVAIVKGISRAVRGQDSRAQSTEVMISVPEDEEFHRIVEAEWPSS